LHFCCAFMLLDAAAFQQLKPNTHLLAFFFLGPLLPEGIHR
jgi:hypothetical protein